MADVAAVPIPRGGVEAATPGDSRTYNFPGLSFGELEAFYRSAMPPGAPWRGIPWCEQRELTADGRSIWTSWRRPGDSILTVIIVEDPAKGPGVVIASTEDDPFPCEG